MCQISFLCCYALPYESLLIFKFEELLYVIILILIAYNIRHRKHLKRTIEENKLLYNANKNSYAWLCARKPESCMYSYFFICKGFCAWQLSGKPEYDNPKYHSLFQYVAPEKFRKLFKTFQKDQQEVVCSTTKFSDIV